jgi:hypothetical protein
MTITKRRQRTAKKLILPMIAVGLMAAMMYLHRPHQASASAPGAPAAPSAPVGSPAR